MHIFTRSVTCMQNIEGIQRKLWEELITQSMHYQPLFTGCGLQKMSKFKTLSFYQKNIFSASNFFMHMFTRSLVSMQNIEKDPIKLWEELITQSMHYQPLFIKCSCQKTSRVQNSAILSKNIFSASNFFMHVFNISVTCTQILKRSKVSSKRSWLHKVCTISHYTTILLAELQRGVTLLILIL